MSGNGQTFVREPSESWGGPWTERKLNAFAKYVDAYLTIMQANPYWKTIYFDGFAGTGSRQTAKTQLYEQLQFTAEEEAGYKGSAERVIRLDKSFDYYYFVDDRQSLDKLKTRLLALPESEGKKLLFRPEDCNLELEQLGKALQTDKFAALVLLDPFGMHVEWNAIAGLAETRSDLWILIPTGVIVNRLLDRAAKLEHIARLESFFGLSEAEIREEFFRRETKMTLFGEETVMEKIEGAIHHIADLYIRQLKTIWKHVTTQPLILCNSRNVPIYHFVFASNNPTAVKIARDIIRKV
ncbi:MAG: three-Cys-motif partner protein TcmP [Chlorobium limicola]|nr:three-Cys-motif partner protein TcmP [Chlorobium limicola]